MWVCQSAAAPEILFSSSRDATGFLPGWTCRKVSPPFPGSTVGNVTRWWKIARALEGIPF